MKKNKTMRLASGLLVAVLLTTCAISGTFAKYVSDATNSDTARVAKWDIQLNDKSIEENLFTFDLFKTVNDTKDGNEEEDIKVADGTIIAPGTKGSFDIILKNASEVNAEYDIAYVVTNASNIPVQFSVDGGTTWKSNIADLNVTDVALAMNASKTVTVQWQWVFEGANVATDDVTDTNLGIAGTATVQVDATVTVTQVD